MKRNQVARGIHDDAPKRATMHNAAAVETVRSKIFIRSHNTGRITTREDQNLA
jgi:hypothetical protein